VRSDLDHRSNVRDADSYAADTSIFLDDAGRPRIFSTRSAFVPASFCDSGLFPELGNLLETISACWSYVSAIQSSGRKISIADTHGDNAKHFVVSAYD
jgi:hypothetical protein